MTSFFEKWLHYCHLKVRTNSNEILGSQNDLFFSVYTADKSWPLDCRGPEVPPYGKHTSVDYP